MHKYPVLNKKDNKISKVYLIEVNTLKRFFEEKYHANNMSTCFHPCPEAKKQEILDKAKGKKRKNAEWFLSLQLDMFGDSQDIHVNDNNHKKIIFSLLNEDEGAFFINGKVDGNVSFGIEKDSSGRSFAIIPESLLQNLDTDIFSNIKKVFAKKHSGANLFLSKEVPFDLARSALDPEKNKVVSGIVSGFEFDFSSDNLSILLSREILNSAIKKSSNTCMIESKYISCEDFLKDNVCKINFYIKNNNIIFLPIGLNKDSISLAISSSILTFIETGKVKYLNGISDDIFKETRVGVDLSF